MIISRTPFRVSLFGGGTDYPSYYERFGGAVLGFALNHYCYLTVRRLPPFFRHRHRLVYSRIELVEHYDRFEHPAARAVLGSLSYLIGDDGLEIHHDGDLPARAGLGSSSSFIVGLLSAVNALYGRSLHRDCIANEAIRIERDVVGDVVGSQDQVFAAHGGFNVIKFHAGRIDVVPINLPPFRERELLDHLILVFTGTTRIAAVVAAAQDLRMTENLPSLHRMATMVVEARDVLIDLRRPISEIGELLDEGWRLKRSLSSLVSTPIVNDIYTAARRAGAIGGKLIGAGGGGFMLLFVPPSRRRGVLTAIDDPVEVPIGIDFTGSNIVLNEPGGFR